jgi:2-methylcitrate dehydratase PrpD
MSWTRQVANFATSLTYENLSPKVVDIVKKAFTDTLGCIIAGSKEQVTRILMDQIITMDSDKPISTLVAQGRKIGPVNAALINGVMAHALDYDDVNAPTHGHPSTVIIPASLAAAELAGVNGKKFITAYVTGFEVMSVLGEVLGFTHYQKGWHTTASLGTLGATVAASHALSLDTDDVVRALSIAVSQTAGTRQNFGTMMKPFHAGNAARIGVLSALLSKGGFTANESILESPMGYFQLYAGEEKVNVQQGNGVFDSLGKRFRILEPGIDVKKYPCCYWTARAADAMLDIAKNETITAEQIEKIEVITPAGGLGALIYDRPNTGLQGKFSMEYVVAAAFLDRKLNFRSFEDTAVRRIEIIRLEQKVVKWEDPSLSVEKGPNEGHVVVKVFTNDGRKIERKVEIPRGAAQKPLTLKEMQEKLEDCIEYAGKEYDAQVFLDQIQSLEDVANIQTWSEKFM